jgi:hypothetical protein
MVLGNIHSSSKTRSWSGRAERACASKVDFYSELRAWVQHGLLEAEKNHDSKKSALFLSLLKEL